MRLATWNILADSYVKPERYVGVPERLLDPRARGTAVLARARLLEAHVLCLQEVEPRAFAALAAGLKLDGFEGTYEQKSQGKPDGCAIFWRGATLLGRDALHYSDGGRKAPSGHLALRVRLGTDLGVLDVVTTHFQWSDPKLALSERRAAREAEEVAAWLAPTPGISIFCGDLNVGPDDEVMALLLKGSLRDVHGGAAEPATCCTARHAHKVDHVLVRGGLPAVPGVAVSLQVTSLPDDREPSDHVPLVVEVG